LEPEAIQDPPAVVQPAPSLQLPGLQPEAELHAWLEGAQLKPTDATLTSRDPLAGRRQVTWASALPMLRRSWTGQLSDEPAWTTQAKVSAEYEALVVQVSEPAAR